jgi:hypothetical protein
MENDTDEVLSEVRQLLESKRDIATKPALRLILAMQDKLIKEFSDVKKIGDNNQLRVKMLEDKSIVLWAEGHPKLFWGLIGLYVALSASLDLKALFSWIFSLVHL